jgi:hypothetical protein
MTAQKRTEITVETDNVLIIRRRRSIRGWCAECGCEVNMVGLAEAEAVARMTAEALRDRAQARGWHLSAGRDGNKLVCLESLLRSL